MCEYIEYIRILRLEHASEILELIYPDELGSPYELLDETEEITITCHEYSTIVLMDHETRMHDELCIDISFDDFSLDECLLEDDFESELLESVVK
jgi:hypothetical protein